MISEYKNRQPRGSTPDPSGVEFSQKSYREYYWHKESIFHHCNKKVHIRPNCAMFERNKDNDEEEYVDPPVPTKKATK